MGSSRVDYWLALAGTVVACSSHVRPTDAQTDLSIDAVTPRPDATDLGIDRTVALSDAPAPDGYALYPWSPQGCSFYHATDPAASVPPLQWTPCSDGAAGCLELVKHWSMTGTSDDRIGDLNAGYTDGMGAWLLIDELGYPLYERQVVTPVDGTPVAAYLAPIVDQTVQPYCPLWFPALGDGMYAVLMARISDHGTDPFDFAVVRGTLSAPSAETIGPIVNGAVPGLPGGSLPSLVSIGRRQMGLAMNVGWIARITGTFSRITPLNGQIPQDFSPRVVAGDILYASDLSQLPDGSVPSSINVAPLDGGVFPLVSQPGCVMLTVHSDGSNLVWVCGSGVDPATLTPTHFEIWTSPFARSSAQLSPHYVGEAGNWDTTPGAAMLGFARFATRRDAGTIRIFNLRDGTFWDVVDSWPGTEWGNFLYVGPDEFAVELHGASSSFVSTIVRRRFDALGAPSPAILRDW